jgi:hypothetical protein
VTILYPKDSDHIKAAPTGAAGSNDVSSGAQPATVSGTLGNTTVPATLPGQDIGIASDATFHTKSIVP